MNSRIGLKSPEELFADTLNLHGDFIKTVGGLSALSWEALLYPVNTSIKESPEKFYHFMVSDYKKMLTRMAGCVRGEEINVMNDFIELFNAEQKPQPEVKVVIKKPEPNKEPPYKTCNTCEVTKSTEEFRTVKGGAKGKQCSECFADTISKGRNKGFSERKRTYKEQVRKEVAEEFTEKLRDLQQKNGHLSSKLEACKSRKVYANEEDVDREVLGSGLYFMSAILKDPESGKLDHVTDQVEAKSKEEAIGLFVLKELVQGQIIISIGYEASIHN